MQLLFGDNRSLHFWVLTSVGALFVLRSIYQEEVTGMKMALPTKEDLSGRRFGRLVVLKRSDQRASRGNRTVPLWECRCDCGGISYKATDTLTRRGIHMCSDCAVQYALQKARENAGFVDGTQITKLKIGDGRSSNSSGIRGVYYDKASQKYRARLKFKGKLLNFGSYDTLDEAIAARREAEKTYFGEYLTPTEETAKK